MDNFLVSWEAELIMSELINTTEMYLKTVYEMQEDGVVPLRARIVERLDHSGPTVSQTVNRMERDGLLTVARNREIQLTDLGFARALDVIRKHRLAERLLLDVIKLDWVLVHSEACRWEHVMSDAVEMNLQDILSHPSSDPYGNPIPEPGDEIRAPGTPIIELTDTYGGIVATKVIRIGEPIQATDRMLAYFVEADIRPGSSINLLPHNDEVAVTGVSTGKSVLLSNHLAQHLFVDPLA